VSIVAALANGQSLVPAQITEPAAIVQAHDVIGVSVSEEHGINSPDLFPQDNHRSNDCSPRM